MQEIGKGLNKIFNLSIITSVIIFVLGVFLFFEPDTIIRMISIILGVIILIPGITSLLDYRKTKYQPNLVTGVITVIIGLILIINTKFVASILPFILGIYFVINGINRLQYALELKRQKISPYRSSFFLSLLIIICGILFIINPFGGAVTITQVIGIFMIIYAILDIWNSMIIKKEMKQTRDRVIEAIIEEKK